VEALETRASLDRNRLPRGRTYARTGAVERIELSEGEVKALVQGSRPQPYSVRVRVREFSDDEWDTILDALAAELGHTAALLDGELPPEVAGDVRGAGFDLLPGAGELVPRCSCPDWADPCKHSAAVCYLVADELDRDPFALLLLRGRPREALMAGLRQRRAGATSTAVKGAAGSASSSPPGSAGMVPPADVGMRATEAWARVPGTLPVLPLPPRAPGSPTVLAADPPPASGVSTGVLRSLAVDAAARAWEVATGAGQGALCYSFDEDLARRAAATLAAPGEARSDEPPGELALLAALARRARLAPRELHRRASVWRDGGREGLAVLLGPLEAAPGDLQRAGDHLATAAGPGARISVRQNRVTAGDRQLRIGRDGRWYPYRRGSGGSFEPAGTPIDPDGLPGENG
jgi:SWIM zinc finger